MSSKTIVSIGMAIGMIVGGFIPWLFGDHSMIDGWSILGGFIGGIAGIWAGVKVNQRLR